MFLDNCFDFEDNSRIMEYTYSYKNIHIWPYLRHIILFKIVQKMTNNIVNQSFHWQKNFYRDYIKYNTFKLPRKEILFINDASSYISNSDGKLFDRLIDEFAIINKEETVKIIQCNENIDLNNLKNNDIPFSIDVFLNDLIRREGEHNNAFNSELKNIKEFIKYLKKEFPYEIEEGVYRLFEQIALKIIKEFPYYYKYYKRLIDIVSPKIVLCLCGIYGQPLIKVFNDYGIVTAEFQHGQISKSHYAYSHAEKISKSKIYRQYMPKYFLSWGDFWTRGMNIPANIYSIGNPIITNKLEQYTKENIKEIQNNILIVLSGRVDIFVKFVRDLLKNNLNEFKIFIKLHPALLSDSNYFIEFENNSNVKVIKSGDIYNYIFEVEYVISDASTVLYEASALGKKVFVLNDVHARMAIREELGIWINTAGEFVEYVSKGYKPNLQEGTYFEKNWKANYVKFIQDVV